MTVFQVNLNLSVIMSNVTFLFGDHTELCKVQPLEGFPL